jgi:hypothetical protein
LGVDEAAKLIEVGKELTQQISTFNIVFVVDGGEEMSEITPTTYDIIERLSYKVKENERNTVRFGAVVYRDSADVSCSSGNAAVAKKAITYDTYDILGFLNSQASIKGCKTGNKALNQALVQAINMLGEARRSQSNFVILLCGAQGRDKYNKMYGDAVVQRMLAESRVNFCVVQMKQGATGDYNDVVPRYKGIFQKACQTLIEDEKRQAALYFEVSSKFQESEIFNESGPGSFMYADYPTTSPLIGMMGTVSNIAAARTEVFARLDSLLKFAFDDADRKIAFIESKIIAAEQEPWQLGPGNLRNFNEMQLHADNKQLLQNYQEKLMQYFVPAYTSATVGRLKEPVFSRVIFATQDEYNDLMASMYQLQSDLNISETRKRIKQNYIRQLAVFLGEEMAKKEIENGLTVSAMLEKYISGIKPKSEWLNRRINDLEDSNIVSDEELGRILARTRSSYRRLKEVVGNQNMVMKGELGIYFWIPAEYFL